MTTKTIICLASYFKGTDFIRACKDAGHTVFLVTKEKWMHEAWPHDCIEQIISVHNDAPPEVYVHVVSELARPRKVDLIVALEEFDVVTAGLIREHLRLPGMSISTARRFRDKLAMNQLAREVGLKVPEFVHLLNYQEVGAFMDRVPPPWVLKPRSDVSAIGIRKLEDSERVWRTIDELDARERLVEKSHYSFLAQFVPGDVYHVDSIVEKGKVLFAGVNRYGRPPMEVAHGGGLFLTYTVEHGSEDQTRLLDIHQKLVTTLGLVRGATHAEFIKSQADGEFYFLEIAARIGGAYIAETLEAARGVNLWREWARIELAAGDGSYTLPPVRDEYAGIALSLARQEWPDTSAYTDPEIAYRVSRKHHVGLVVRSRSQARVLELLDQYAHRFSEDFVAVQPPLERAE